MQLTVLGCAGTFPGPASPCSGYLVEHDGYRLVLDFGAGALGNLQRHCDLRDIDAMYITHLHADHCIDLVAYFYARRYHPEGAAPKLTVHGPSTVRQAIEAAYVTDVSEMLDTVYDFQPVTAEGTRQIGPFEVRFIRVNHPVETYAMRVSAGGKTVAYSADTGECDALVDLARDVDLFLCEASYLEGDANPPDVHLTGRMAGRYAAVAAAKRLVLTHLVPWGDQARTLAEAEGAYDGEILVARPLDSYDV